MEDGNNLKGINGLVLILYFIIFVALPIMLLIAYNWLQFKGRVNMEDVSNFKEIVAFSIILVFIVFIALPFVLPLFSKKPKDRE